MVHIRSNRRIAAPPAAPMAMMAIIGSTVGVGPGVPGACVDTGVGVNVLVAEVVASGEGAEVVGVMVLSGPKSTAIRGSYLYQRR